MIRNLRLQLARAFGALATLPFRFVTPQIQEPQRVSHIRWPEVLAEKFNVEGARILEIGSRKVTGSNFRTRFTKAHYVGFDFEDGENVDVVGDAHRLSDYFDENERFDLIFSSAVFEHLYMPWVCVPEINKLLKVGGHVFVETHFSFSSHARPWHFFQFSDMGLRSLFNPAMGFEVLDSGMSNPMAGYFSQNAAPHLRYKPIPELYCHSEILCRKSREPTVDAWREIAIDEAVAGSRYPKESAKL